MLCVCFSHDGKRLAVGGANNRCVIYDSRSLRQLGALQQDEVVTRVCFSPDDMRLAVGGDDYKSMMVYDGLTLAFQGAAQ